MAPNERFREEEVGTAAMIRARADELERVAEACAAEAVEQEASARRLRLRAAELRGYVTEYRAAARVAQRVEESGEDPTLAAVPEAS